MGQEDHLSAQTIALAELHALESIVSLLKASPELRAEPGKLAGIDGPLLTSVSFIPNDNNVTSSFSALQKLRGIQNSLSALQHAVSNSIATIKEDIAPLAMQQGMASLPDELLVHIFEEAFGDSGTLFTHRITRVSRRFYDIARKMSLLWTHISLDGNREGLEGVYDNPVTFFDRSKSAKVSLQLELTSTNARVVEFATRVFLPKALECRARWKELVAIVQPHETDMERVKEFEILRQLHFTTYWNSPSRAYEFPALQSITVTYNSLDGEQDEFLPLLGLLDDEETITHFFEKWELPTLGTLEVTNFIPQPVHNSWLSTLTTFHFTFARRSLDGDYGPEHWDPSLGFFDFLNELSSLKTLTLDVTDSIFIVRIDDVVEITSLQQLNIIADLHVGSSSIQSLMENIRVPNIKEMCIDVLLNEDSDFEQWLDLLFLPGRTYSQLTDVHLSIKAADSGNNGFSVFLRSGRPFDKICNNSVFPALSRLSIDAPAIEKPLSNAVLNLPLQSLRLEHCHWSNFDFIKTLLALRKKPGFERIEIAECMELFEELRKHISAFKKLVSGPCDTYLFPAESS